MKPLVWGIRTLARKLEVKRDDIRYLVDSNRVTTSKLKKGNCLINVFDEKAQNLVRVFLDRKRKTGKFG